ncbi:ABC transporter ATP-binding protein, partial [Ectothiorhodospiraceae bacterium WFHF3C12]|nr:ABC transporter ATP-binding protein [Ectothiorhodospiraceae bacterium WFHF3C12]
MAAPRAQMETVVELMDVARRFNGRTALNGLSLRLERGGILGLLGPNGAGKTTAMRLMAGVLPPSSGRIELLGEPMNERRPAQRRHLGYLPDTPPLYEDMAVADYLTHVARLRGLARPAARQRTEAVLEQCDLEAVGRRRIGNLSRGYRQRIGLAQAVIHEPALLILDEPTLGLDPIQVQGLRTLIRGFGRDHAIVLSSHLLAEVQSLCDQVLILNDGECVHSGPLDDEPGLAYRLVTRESVDLERLSALPGVAAASAEGDRVYRLQLAGPADA